MVSSVAFHPNDSNTLVSGSWDRTIKMWHVPSGECKATLKGHRYIFSAITCMGSLGDPSGAWALLTVSYVTGLAVTRYIPWPGVPTASSWHRGAKTRRCASGALKTAAVRRCYQGTGTSQLLSPACISREGDEKGQEG